MNSNAEKKMPGSLPCDKAIRVDRRQFDAVVAALRLLAREIERGNVALNDGDLGDILTCSGDHQGMTQAEVSSFCDAILDGQAVTWVTKSEGLEQSNCSPSPAL